MKTAVEILDDLETLGPPFRASTTGQPCRDVAGGSDAERWFSCGRLVDETSSQLREMISLHAEVRGMPAGRHVNSLVFQRYCHRLCAVGFAVWLRHGVVLDYQAVNMDIRFVDGTPERVALHEVTPRQGNAAELVSKIVEGHLEPLARNVVRHGGPGIPNLMGNIAAGFAGAARKLSQIVDADIVMAAAQEILDQDPRMRRSGTLRRMDGGSASAHGTGPVVQYDRKTCCHWYAAPDGRFCSWCSRLSYEERTARFLAQGS